MGADEGVLIDDPATLDGDSFATATALAAAIKKLGDVDLVICGRQAVDWDMGVTGSVIAGILGWPVVTIARSISVNGKVTVERVLSDGFETVEAPLPCVVTVSNELGEPRYPKLQQIMMAARKQVQVWTAADLGLSPDQVGAAGSKLTLERLYQPVSETKVEIMEGDTPEEQAQNLVRKLREAKLI
jgi:electron transfer flavoprotein beta subunit